MPSVTVLVSAVAAVAVIVSAVAAVAVLVSAVPAVAVLVSAVPVVAVLLVVEAAALAAATAAGRCMISTWPGVQCAGKCMCARTGPARWKRMMRGMIYASSLECVCVY